MSSLLGGEAIKNILVSFWLFIFGAAVSSSAAVYYVRENSPGGCTTSNPGACTWSNAYPSLPATLERGATYYVAGGTYGSAKINTPVNGNLVITIKKATAGEHGTETGWNALYGTTQATINSNLFFRGTGHIVFDGSYRNENDWFDGAAYGFRIYNNGGNNLIKIGEYAAGTASSNLTIKYVYLDGRVAADSGNLIDTYVANEGISTNLVFSRMYLHGGCNNWFMRNATNGLIEYNAASDAMGDVQVHHGEVINLYWGSDNFTVRFNKIRNAYLSGGGTAIVSVDGTNNLKFYGNVIWNFEAGNGVIGPIRANNSVVYGNTIVDNKGSSAGLDLYGTNNYVYNNLWVGNKSAFIHTGSPGVHDYNAYSTESFDTESNGQSSVPTSIFTNYSGKILSLAVDTRPGLNLTMAPGYEPAMGFDITGRPRTTWSRGAYEFGSTTPSAQIHPADTNTDFLMALNEATKYGACWKNPVAFGDCPAGIAIDYAVRAGTLWAGSATGQYQYNSANTCPLCWEVKP